MSSDGTTGRIRSIPARVFDGVRVLRSRGSILSDGERVTSDSTFKTRTYDDASLQEEVQISSGNGIR
jgi:hypothetical protein